MTIDVSAPANEEPQPVDGFIRTKFLSRVTDALLSALALLGVVCIIATIAAFALNISLIMFKTGSMSPTIPTGSLAIVRQIPASDIRVGDVTTVSRGEGQLPVTHRVVSVTPVNGDTYSIAMKGDANDSPDAQPYEVAEVKKVLWHAPGLAYVVAKVSQPIYMAGITIAASLLVVWAFWPRKQQ
ncbi:signal peptidase I [Dietzia sp. ANT_WB102]|uniref:signal peptidase I n=1 Tax=Dietzia sp. ANT_WB102 TaxID=2597345 RepID=UPI0011EFFD00|nr:signal peptidase I [Dietzia sp. ANT_WB102]KAA0918763.1 signal peptidase I [Dietzia sp. ANT_WB102]